MTNHQKVFTRHLLTEKEAASYLSISLLYLRHARCNGTREHRRKAPSHIKIGRAVRYDLDSLQDWVNEHRVNID